jgi:hypothetical protein
MFEDVCGAEINTDGIGNSAALLYNFLHGEFFTNQNETRLIESIQVNEDTLLYATTFRREDLEDLLRSTHNENPSILNQTRIHHIIKFNLKTNLFC